MGGAPIVSGPSIFGLFIWLLYLRFIVPVLGVFYGTSLIADEVEDKTITYLFTRPIPRGAGKDFYDTLFALDPSMKSLFSTDVENQGAMFVVALGLALKGLDEDDGVVDKSRKLRPSGETA